MSSRGVRVGCVVIALAVTGTGSGARTSSNLAMEWDSVDSRRMREQAFRHFRAGEYAKAAEIYRAGYEESRVRNANRTAAIFLNNLAGAQFALLRYRAALDTYLEARKAAEEAGDLTLATTLSANLSSLYLQLNEPALARQALDAATAGTANLPPRTVAMLLLQRMAIQGVAGEMTAVRETFSDALWWADRAGEPRLQAQAWSSLGWTLLRNGDLEAADQALTEAFRIRRLHEPSAVPSAYVRLSSLRLAQGDPASALTFADSAVKASASTPAEPPWLLHYQRGLAYRDLGRLREALDDFRHAVELARRWRLEVAGAERLRTGAEVRLGEIYAAYIDLTSRLYSQRSDRRLAAESLEAAEHSRTAAWRELFAETRAERRRLPEVYYETLAKLRATETELRTRATRALHDAAERLNLDLVEMEEKAGLTPPINVGPRDRLLARTQEALGDDAALFSFYLGEKRSHMWVVTRQSLEFHQLAARHILEALVAKFRNDIARDGDFGESGSQLFTELFGHASAEAKSRRTWRLVLDRGLYDAPMAALVVESAGGRPKFLIEQHSLELSPSVFVAGAAHQAGTGGGFAGFGDPIYNSADPRFLGNRRWWSADWLRKAPSEGQLPRLAGSGLEIAKCAEAFDRPNPILVTGAEASLDRLRRVAENGAGTIHLATHVVPSRVHPDQALLALSLRDPGGVELATPADVSAMRVRADVVVLSGCSSGRGRTVPGVGVMGLTRSWLVAGARAVVASLWTVPDDSGELFTRFYKDLARRGNAAMALGTAQAEMSASDSWRAKPRYWAAYFAVGRN